MSPSEDEITAWQSQFRLWFSRHESLIYKIAMHRWKNIFFVKYIWETHDEIVSEFFARYASDKDNHEVAKAIQCENDTERHMLIARLIDRLRAGRSHDVYGRPGRVSAPIDAVADIQDQEVERQRRREMIHAAIAALPEPNRAVVRRELEGYTLKEIAEELQVTVQTVYRYRLKAWELLRDYLR
jgi:RNA polymerase sigma factor (sigma-70 family)